MTTLEIRFVLNGVQQRHVIETDELLLSVIRDRCGLSGTKEGCSIGVCGTCSVLVDDRLMSACLVPAVFVDGASITTVEGLASSDGRLTALQHRFIADGGFQCGICTSGQLIAATALLKAHPRPDDTTIKSWMMGNLCRCTGYYGIVRAIRGAAGIDA